jgi:hypothetical protein
VQLFNLRKDIGEQQNLAESMPEKVAELRAKLRAWRKDVDAQMNQLNPDYDPLSGI